MPLPAPRVVPEPRHPDDAPAITLPVPPPAPRAFADSYVWRLVFADGLSIVASIFGILGSIFFCLGVPLTLGIITAGVGLPFVLIGGVFLAIGGAIIPSRYQKAQIILNVLRHGTVAYGQITHLSQNYNVRVNRQHPWNIHYQFEAEGRMWEGQVATMNTPGPQLQVGQPAVVLHLLNAPEHNALYPHP